MIKRNQLILFFIFSSANFFFGCASLILTSDLKNNYQSVREIDSTPREINGWIINTFSKNHEEYIEVKVGGILFEEQGKRFVSILIPKKVNPLNNTETIYYKDPPVINEDLHEIKKIIKKDKMQRTMHYRKLEEEILPSEKEPIILSEITELSDTLNEEKVTIKFDKYTILGKSGEKSKFIRFQIEAGRKALYPKRNLDIVTNIIDEDRRFHVICEEDIKWVKRDRVRYILKHFNYLWTVPLDIVTSPIQIVTYVIMKIN